jgi:hypothetical protein
MHAAAGRLDQRRPRREWSRRVEKDFDILDDPVQRRRIAEFRAPMLQRELGGKASRPAFRPART